MAVQLNFEAAVSLLPGPSNASHHMGLYATHPPEVNSCACAVARVAKKKAATKAAADLAEVQRQLADAQSLLDRLAHSSCCGFASFNLSVYCSEYTSLHCVQDASHAAAGTTLTWFCHVELYLTSRCCAQASPAS